MSLGRAEHRAGLPGQEGRSGVPMPEICPKLHRWYADFLNRGGSCPEAALDVIRGPPEQCPPKAGGRVASLFGRTTTSVGTR